jgi:predicted tellurium resistance membrane protein TerC
MKNQIGDGNKRQRRDVLFGLIAAAMSLILLVFVERSLLSVDTPWFVGANCVLVIVIFNVVIRRRVESRRNDK